MRRVYEKIEELLNIWTTCIVAVIYIIAMVVYRNSIGVFEGKAVDFASSIKLIVDYPQQAFGAIASGIVAHIVALFVVIIAIVAVLSVIMQEIPQYKWKYVITFVLMGIIFSTINRKFINAFWILLVSVVIIGILIIAFFSDN